MYTIKYTYDTGDSFHQEEGLESTLDLTWESLEIAEKNLLRIQEHYKMYLELNSRYTEKKNSDILQENQSKDWFVNSLKPAVFKNPKDLDDYMVVDEREISGWVKKGYSFSYIIDKDLAERSLILYTDSGSKWQFSAPWCGYFETLVSVEIVLEGDRFKKIYL